MSISGLLPVLLGDRAVGTAVDIARSGAPTSIDLTAPPGLRPFLVGELAASADRAVLAVTATTREAEDLASALRSLLPPRHNAGGELLDPVAEFPAWETLPHERLSPRSDTVGRRLAVLRRLAHPDESDPATGPISVLVAPVRSLLQPMVAGLGHLEPVQLHTEDEIRLEDVARRLAAAAYVRVDLVERRGEFAVRGGIVDVFPPTEEHPVRVEFWGDTVEEIRYFAVADQRSLETAGHGLWAPPCRELLLTDEVRARAEQLATSHPSLVDMFGRLAQGMAVEGMESLAPVLVDDMELLTDVLPAGAHVVLCDPERVRRRAADLTATSQEFLDASWAAASMGGAGEAPLDLGAAAYKSLVEVRDHAMATGRPWWGITPFTTDEELVAAEDDETYVVGARLVEPYAGDTARAFGDVKGWLGEDWRVVLVAEGHGGAERLVERLKEEGIPARLTDDVPLSPAEFAFRAGDTPQRATSTSNWAGTPGLTAEDRGVAFVTTGCIDTGFIHAALRLVVLTETDLVGQKSSTKDLRAKLPSRRRNVVDPLQLKPGDLVVHEHHGVGRYVEMVQRTVQQATREYLVIEYAPSKRNQPGDRLYVPTDQLDLVTKYVGGENPTLDKMGGGDWTKRKGRARKAVREIAAGLIRLYSARMATKGHAFAADTPWQRELEDAFPYVETPDQASTIDEVKADMEREVPMDRVVCGDVGYGKTEIAVRAAFKAVQDGKQVAVLVPTTLLVNQHLNTFSERYATFPVNVKALSRFQTDKQAREVLAGLADGSVDVVIGTHRLLSPTVKIKDLGLVIVDEEQRFGVEHKEHLKAMRTAVDVLTMSATPIPRTLEMSITGIREMSTILTPPEERHPVLTFVGPYSEKQVGAAIRRELLREGQVFYLHNRVETIDRAAAKLRELVPEARIATAHGQMNEHALEQVVLDFWEKRADVLVCTTIVESGLDISNANTLILERADAYGLSQLHQLRGRVGRGRERAYAYFTYPPDKPLSETAHDRLATIAQNTDLGAGMAVAMKDLEIRGAGNLLGGEQSGHIADVGFDLYMRLVGEAVSDFRRGDDEAEEVSREVKVELPIDAHLPHEYVPGERLRLEAYRKIASAESEDDIAAVRAELVDRYAEPPAPVDKLLAVARFRMLARKAGVTEVALAGPNVRFVGLDLPDSMQVRLQRLYPRSILKPASQTLMVPVPKGKNIGSPPLRDVELLTWCGELIQALVPAAVAA